jgi:hypothetical protein
MFMAVGFQIEPMLQRIMHALRDWSTQKKQKARQASSRSGLTPT